MNNPDISLIYAVCFGVFLLLAYSVLAVLQGLEVLRPKNDKYAWLPRVRMRLFLLFVFAVITLIPALVYRFCLLLGIDAPGLLDISRVTSSLNQFASLYLIFSLYLDAYKSRRK